jgi:hypothetical protein
MFYLWVIILGVSDLEVHLKEEELDSLEHTDFLALEPS